MNDDKDQNKPEREDQKKPKDEGKQEGFETDGLDEDGNPLDGGINYLDRNTTLDQRANWFMLSRPRNPEEYNITRTNALKQQQEMALFESTDSGETLEWFPIGPRNINGRVKCLAVHPIDENILFAGAASGGLWRSDNGGRNWISISETEIMRDLGRENVVPAIGSIDLLINEGTLEILVGTGEAVGVDASKTFHNFPGNGLYYFDGVSWEHINYSGVTTPINYRTFSKVLFCTNSKYKFYVGGPDGFFGIKKVGDVWVWDTFNTGIVSDAAIDPSDSNVVYFCCDRGNTTEDLHNSGVYWTQEGDLFDKIEYRFPVLPATINWNWPKISLGSYETDYVDRFLVLKVDKYVFSSFRADRNLKVLSYLNTDLTPPRVIPIELLGNASWCSCITINPTVTPDSLTGSVEYSVIGGSTRLKMFSGLPNSTWELDSTSGIPSDPHDDHQMIVFAPSNSNIVYLANDGGVYRSHNSGEEFYKISNGLQITQFYALGNWYEFGTSMGGGTQDQGSIATSGGLTWEMIDENTDGGYVLFDSEKPFKIFTEKARQSVKRSVDGGESFDDLISVICPCSPHSCPSLFDPWLRVLGQIQKAHTPDLSSDIYFTGDKNVFRFIVDSGDWIPISKKHGTASPEDLLGIDDGFITSIGISARNPEQIYAGTGDLKIRSLSDPASTKIFFFDNSILANCREDWLDVTNNLGPGLKQPITDIVINPVDSNDIFISLGWNYNGGIPQSVVYRGEKNTEGTSTTVVWTPLTDLLASGSTRFPSTSANALAIHPDYPNLLFVGTDIGVFVHDISIPLSLLWERAGIGLPDPIVTDLRVDEDNKSLLAATFGRGAFRLNLEGPDNARVYLRTNALDTGEDGSAPNNEYNPLLDQTKVRRDESPDIKVFDTVKFLSLMDPYGEPISEIDGIEFDNAKESVIIPESRYHVCVQVHNKGIGTATNVKVSLFFGVNRRGGELPSNYSAFTDVPSFNDHWKRIGYPQTIPELDANIPKVLVWEWTSPPMIRGNSYLFAVVTSDEDAYSNIETKARKLALKERKAALKRLKKRKRKKYRGKISFIDKFQFVNEKDEEIKNSFEFNFENYVKGRIGLFLPDNCWEKLNLKSLEFQTVGFQKNEFQNNWLSELDDEDNLYLKELLEKVNTTKILEFGPYSRIKFNDVFLEKDEIFEGIIWGDRKARSVLEIDIHQIEENEIISTESLYFPAELIESVPPPGFAKLRVTILRIEIIKNFDFWCQNSEEFSFASNVELNRNGLSIQKRFPSKGYFKVKKSLKVKALDLEARIFEGIVQNGDSLEIRIIGREHDFFLKPDDKLTTFNRTFIDEIEGWIGIYSPDDEKNDPESLPDWKIWYRIEKL